MANIIKLLPGLENGSIQFNRINTSPEEYTNVHTVLFNGDQEGFEITTDSSGGFTKLVDSVSIDWQGAQMPNTAQLLGLVNGISLNNTAQLIDIIERICAKLNDGGIPEPSEPTIESISVDSTDINIDYLTTFTPVIKATYTDASIHTLDNSLFAWTIGDSSIISQNNNNIVTGIKTGNTSLIAILKEDNTKYITFNINVNKVDISRVTFTGISDQTIGRDYDGTPVVLQNVVLKWKTETLTENTQYTVTYSNNVGNVDSDITATSTFDAIDNTNYTGSNNKTFKIKHTNKSNSGIVWSSNAAIVQIGEQNTFPTLTNPHNLQVTYSSSETGVATINANGIVTLVHDGETVISAIFVGDNYYNEKTVTYTLTVQPAAVIPEYYWYCGPISESGENMIEISENTYIPTIENNFIDESEQLSDLPGWRKIDMNSSSNYIYICSERGDYPIYLDGRDENNNPTYEEYITAIVALPVDCNLTLTNAINSTYNIYKTITYNNISYNIYIIENVDEFVLTIKK